MKSIVTRVDPVVHTALLVMAKQNNLSVNKLVNEMFLKMFADPDCSFKKDLQSKINEYERTKKLAEANKNIKAQRRCHYLIANSQRAIFNFAMSSIINSDNIDMKVIKAEIDSTVEIYKHFPKKIKRYLSHQIKDLKKLKKESIMRTKFNDFMKFRQQTNLLK